MASGGANPPLAGQEPRSDLWGKIGLETVAAWRQCGLGALQISIHAAYLVRRNAATGTTWWSARGLADLLGSARVDIIRARRGLEHHGLLVRTEIRAARGIPVYRVNLTLPTGGMGATGGLQATGGLGATGGVAWAPPDPVAWAPPVQTHVQTINNNTPLLLAGGVVAEEQKTGTPPSPSGPVADDPPLRLRATAEESKRAGQIARWAFQRAGAGTPSAGQVGKLVRVLRDFRGEAQVSDSAWWAEVLAGARSWWNPAKGGLAAAMAAEAAKRLNASRVARRQVEEADAAQKAKTARLIAKQRELEEKARARARERGMPEEVEG